MSIDVRTVPLLADYLHFFAEGQARPGLFADEVVWDMNVPHWRFQVQGPRAVQQLRREAGGRWEVTIGAASRMEDGFVVETAVDEVVDGQSVYTRSINLVTVREGQIVQVRHYCTGPWDAATRRRQQAQAPMVDPQ